MMALGLLIVLLVFIYGEVSSNMLPSTIGALNTPSLSGSSSLSNQEMNSDNAIDVAIKIERAVNVGEIFNIAEEV